MSANSETSTTAIAKEKYRQATPKELYQHVEIIGYMEKQKKPEFGGEEAGYPSHTMIVGRKEKGPMAIVCSFIVQHQIGLAVNLLTLLALTHLCLPKARRHTRKFFELSYYDASTGEYCAGWNDAFVVFYWIVVFTELRAAVMDYFLNPFAKRAGVKTEKDQTRFAEQAWVLVYYTVFWTLGMRILLRSNYWWDFKELWTNWPNREIEGLRKWYILVQFAFWLQQIFVINIEKRRKDHWQMFTHHIVMCVLIFTSYGYHHTKVANLILCTMDIVDLIFPAAKCLKYLGYSTLCDIFGLFMFTWIGTGHIYYPMICYSIWAELPVMVKYGCYHGKQGSIIGPLPVPSDLNHYIEPFHDPEGIVCWDNKVNWGFLGPLLFLQCITLWWLTLIFKVAWKVIQGGEAEDNRSDDEEEEEDHEDISSEAIDREEYIEQRPPFEEEVGVEAINFHYHKGRLGNPSRSNRYRKGTSSSSGVSIPGHSDRKELLGRIGCDKGNTSYD